MGAQGGYGLAGCTPLSTKAQPPPGVVHLRDVASVVKEVVAGWSLRFSQFRLLGWATLSGSTMTGGVARMRQLLKERFAWVQVHALPM